MRKLLNLENGGIFEEVLWFKISKVMKKRADLLKAVIIMVNNSLINLLPDGSKIIIKQIFTEYYKKNKKGASLLVGVSDTIINTRDFIFKEATEDKNGEYEFSFSHNLEKKISDILIEHIIIKRLKIKGLQVSPRLARKLLVYKYKLFKR